MQSDGNSFSGDVVLNDFDMVFSDENNKLDKIYQKQIFPVFFFKFWNSMSDWRKYVIIEIHHLSATVVL